MLPELWNIPIVDYPIKSYGFMLMVGFFTAAYIAAKRAEKVRANPDVVLNCAIFALLGSMPGARLFYVVHYWDTHFANTENPLLAAIDISKGGMEFYGGIAGALALILAYLVIKRESVRLYFDILTPGLMWGLAFARVGCFLNGCCWGGVCEGTVANNWAVEFPYGSPAHHRQFKDHQIPLRAELLQIDRLGRFSPLSREHVFMEPAQRDKYVRLLDEANQRYIDEARLDENSPQTQAAKREIGKFEKFADIEAQTYESITKNLRTFWSSEYPGQKITPSELAELARESKSLPVHPSQLYATINALLGSLFLSWVFRVRQRHGMVFAIWLLTYPWTRIFLEQIRVDNPLDTLGLTVSTALSIVMLVAGLFLAIWFKRMPLHSPYAKAWEPAPDPSPEGRTATA